MRRFTLRRQVLLAGALAVALGAAGFAIADPGSGGTSLVSATFYANTLSQGHTWTCTASNNDAIQLTDAVFAGTASSSDPRLAGALTIHVRSSYDSTTNAGALSGDLRIDPSSPSQGHFDARLDAVDVNGSVQGFLRGDAGHWAGFLGSFASTFSATTGFSSSGTPGAIGAGSATNTAVFVSGGCQKHMPPPAPSTSTSTSSSTSTSTSTIPGPFQPFRHGKGHGHHGNGNDND